MFGMVTLTFRNLDVCVCVLYAHSLSIIYLLSMRGCHLLVGIEMNLMEHTWIIIIIESKTPELFQAIIDIIALLIRSKIGSHNSENSIFWLN